MNQQKVEQSIKQILEKCGEGIIQNHNQFQSAVFDLLDSIHYADERLVMKHAMDSDTFWILLGTMQITAESAKKAIGQIQKESHMAREDVEFVVRCVVAARGGKLNVIMGGEAAKTSILADWQRIAENYNIRNIVTVTFVNALDSMSNDALDLSKEKDRSVMAWTEHEGDYIHLFVGAKGRIAFEDYSGMFNAYVNVKKIEFGNCIDTSNAMDMSKMFANCENLKEIDLNHFNTSQVTDMSTMFYGCGCLKELDLCNFDTSQVTDMSEMFGKCISLETLGIGGFNTSQVTNMRSMFFGCNMEKLDVSGFDTSRVTDMSSMFGFCGNLQSLDISGFNTSQVKDMGSMFVCCGTLSSLDVSGFDTSQVTNMAKMFDDCFCLEKLDLSSFDTRHVTDMSYMFYGCGSLEKLDVGSFDTSQVTNMEGMFCLCTSLKEFDAGSFDMSQVTNAEFMFGGIVG